MVCYCFQYFHPHQASSIFSVQEETQMMTFLFCISYQHAKLYFPICFHTEVNLEWFHCGQWCYGNCCDKCTKSCFCYLTSALYGDRGNEKGTKLNHSLFPTTCNTAPVSPQKLHCHNLLNFHTFSILHVKH